MSDLVRLMVLFLAAANPPRLHGAVPRAGLAVAGVGGAVAVGVAWVLAAASDPILDWLDVTVATARIAAGLLVVATGLWHLFAGPPRPWDIRRHDVRAAVVPVAFPVLLQPGVTLLALSAGADEGAAVATAAAGIALALAAAAVTLTSDRARSLRAAARLLGAVAVLFGIDLVVDGVLDV